MEFYNVADKYLCKVDYQSPEIKQYDKFKMFMNDIIYNKKRVLIYGDYDPDGAFCVLQWRAGLRLFNVSDYEIFKYRKRMHTLDPFAVDKAMEGRFDYIIISDAASNDMENINRLVGFGVKVIIVDHHECKYSYADYPEDCCIINTMMENRENEEVLAGKQEPFVLSGGALVFVLLYKLAQDYRIPCHHLAPLAVSSMYADCVDMSSELARGMYFMARDIDAKMLPAEVDAFLNNYTRFSRRFVEFQMTPKLNAAFRMERFNYLNDNFLSKKLPTRGELNVMVSSLTELHQHSSELVSKATDIIYHEVKDNFVIGNLNTVNEHIDVRGTKLYNYTGLIANKLAERYKKSAVVYYGMDGKIKGSFRDLYGRNYLNIFQSFSESQGHPSAFGIKLNALQISDFLHSIDLVDSNFAIKGINNEPIIEGNWGNEPPDDRVLNDMAMYNEFAGIKLPFVLLEVYKNQSMRETRTHYGEYMYRWGDRNIHSRRRIINGSKMLIRPTVGKSVKLHAL
ncbi:hypothetical protein UT300012_23830 [Paraclostridium bifermentans]